jgi:hypothetical protein
MLCTWVGFLVKIRITTSWNCVGIM